MLQAFRGYRSEEFPPAVRNRDRRPIPFRAIARAVFSPYVAIALSVLTCPFVALPLMKIVEGLLNQVLWVFVAGSSPNEYDFLRRCDPFVIGSIRFATVFAVVALAVAFVQRQYENAIIVGVALAMTAVSWGIVWMAHHIVVPFQGM